MNGPVRLQVCRTRGLTYLRQSRLMLAGNLIMTKDKAKKDKVKSILVVDDEEIMRDFLVDVLDDYSVTTASDGDEAIALMRKERYDLIITDLKMPRVSGEEVVRQAVEIDANYKVIVISGYSTLFTVAQSIENGACAFLSKPFSIQQLRAEVTRTLEDCADQPE